MNKMKLMTIVGTRPEIIKLSEIIKRCDRYFDHILVHTGQNWDYNLNEIFFKELGLRKPDFYLDSVGNNLGQTIGNIISKSYALLVKEKPDAILILGDTNSALSAISAKRLKIPIFHMEAGNRCFDENLPEEVNRRILDHISDVNLPYTENARWNLFAEGIAKERVFVTGSPMAEVLKTHAEEISESNVLNRLELEPKNYILLSAHREENIDIEKNFNELTEAINQMASFYRMPIIYSMHPRSEKIIKARGFQFCDNVRALKPFGFFDYNKLQQNAFCVVSDSGTLAEESSLLNFPAVSIRTSTERPEAVDKGSFLLGGITADQVMQTVQLATSMYANHDFGGIIPDYTDVNCSVKVVKLIQGFTSIVNKRVWGK